jgi:hypothetical protein
MQQLLDIGFSHRAKPITEPGVPAERVEVNGQWQVDVARLSADTVFAVYKFDRKYSFNLQVNLCELDGSPIVPDGTLLGGRETASTFYEGNYLFFLREGETEKFNRCADQTGMRFEADPLSSKGATLYHSHDRVLREMCNWLRFLALDKSDPSRAVDFLAFIVGKHREELLRLDSAGDTRFLRQEISFFDRTFPFEVFDTNLLSGIQTRNRAREFLQTTIALRRKLAPTVTKQITRDEELLHRLR